MTAHKSDGNQAEIVAGLRECGCEVFDLHDFGRGLPDLLVCRADRLFLLEVKTRKGRMTPPEIAFRERFPVDVVHSLDEALRAVGL